MPRYDYICGCGEIIEKEFQMANMKKTIKCPKCGKKAKRNIGYVNAIVRHRLGESRIGRGKGY